MALFKIYNGDNSDFSSVGGFSKYPRHPGYAYFFEDNGAFVVDTETGRYTVNASRLISDLHGLIDVDEVLYSPEGITKNAIIVGGEDPNTVRAIAIDPGALVMGDSRNGVAGLKGTGALYAMDAGRPQFGTLPIYAGGLGASTYPEARGNLDVYSKKETDDNITKATSLAYTTTLSASGWSGNANDGYIYSYTNTALTCGKNGDVPPIITWTSNREDYSKITSAEATVKTGIIFTAEEAISGDIGIVIIDVK